MGLYLHAYTCYSSVRPFGITAIVGLVDKEGPQLYMFEPSGVYWVKHEKHDNLILILILILISLSRSSPHFRVINVVLLVKEKLSPKLNSKSSTSPPSPVVKP